MTETTKRRTYYDSDRVRQAQLRERRKEQGWKRVSIWLSPEQVDSLETLGGESWLGRTVKELLTGAVSERQQPAKPAALFVGAEPLPDTANKPVSDNAPVKEQPQGKTPLFTDIKPLPDTANKPVSDNAKKPLPDNRAELAKLGHALLRTGVTKAAIAAHFNQLGATPNRIPKTTGTKPRADSAATWTVKSVSQFLLRDYPEA